MNVWYMMSKEVRMLWYIVYVPAKYVSIHKIWQKEKGYLSEVKKRSNYVRPSTKKTTEDKLEEIRGYNYKSKKIKSPN